MPLPYPTKVVLPFDIATAQDMNERHANDVALANGTGLDDESVTFDNIDTASFPQIAKYGSDTSGIGSAVVTIANSSLTFSLLKPTKVKITFGGTMRITGGELQFFLNVNGTDLGATSQRVTFISSATDSQATLSRSLIISLPAGSNTIYLKASGGGSNNQIYGPYWDAVIVG